MNATRFAHAPGFFFPNWNTVLVLLAMPFA